MEEETAVTWDGIFELMSRLRDLEREAESQKHPVRYQAQVSKWAWPLIVAFRIRRDRYHR
jgi:hypothetical protein